MGTPFTTIYNRFLGKVTDDLYMELTPQDTLRDLSNILITSLPGFEFPRFSLYDYSISTEKIPVEDYTQGFVLKADEDFVEIDNSKFSSDLTEEEVNILAILMMSTWLQRQVASIENTRMKYSGPDFKMTSQANHLAKLLTLVEEVRRDSTHM